MNNLQPTAYGIGRSWKHVTKTQTRQAYPLLSMLFNIVMDISAITIRQEIKAMKIMKDKIKQPLFVDYIILFLEEVKDFTKGRFEFIREFGEVAGYKINPQTSIALVCKIMTMAEKGPVRSLSFILATKHVKYLVIN